MTREKGIAMLAPTRNWRLAAACRWSDPDLFFPLSSSGRSLDQVARAKEVCAGCTVRAECLAFALRTSQAHGVWGGTSEQERYPGADRGERLHELRPAASAAGQFSGQGMPPAS
jgi:WhiB family redox-sensing transcriptional regulator